MQKRSVDPNSIQAKIPSDNQLSKVDPWAQLNHSTSNTSKPILVTDNLETHISDLKSNAEDNNPSKPLNPRESGPAIGPVLSRYNQMFPPENVLSRYDYEDFTGYPKHLQKRNRIERSSGIRGSEDKYDYPEDQSRFGGYTSPTRSLKLGDKNFGGNLEEYTETTHVPIHPN
jgi:hypothetical protein